MMRYVDADVLAANEAFYRAFNERDIEAMDELWSRESPVWCVHPGWDPLSGRDTVMQSWRAILGNPLQTKIVAGGASVLTRGDMALVSCRELAAGNPLAATNVFVHEGEGWKLVQHHSSPVARR